MEKFSHLLKNSRKFSSVVSIFDIGYLLHHTETGTWPCASCPDKCFRSSQTPCPAYQTWRRVGRAAIIFEVRKLFQPVSKGNIYHILELGWDGVGSPSWGIILDHRRLEPCSHIAGLSESISRLIPGKYLQQSVKVISLITRVCSGTQEMALQAAACRQSVESWWRCAALSKLLFRRVLWHWVHWLILDPVYYKCYETVSWYCHNNSIGNYN